MADRARRLGDLNGGAAGSSLGPGRTSVTRGVQASAHRAGVSGAGPACRQEPPGSSAGMSAEDKISNKIDELAGKGKEVAGRATGNPDLEAEGKAEQAKSNLKQAGEKVKDVFK